MIACCSGDVRDLCGNIRVLEAEISHRFGDFELDAAFSIDARGVIALYGPSGAGKTSLVNFLAGLLRPDRGRIVFNGAVLCDTERGVYLPPHRRHVGYVFQDSLLFPHLNVRHNLSYGMGRSGAAPGVGFDQVVDVLAIRHLLARLPHGLSGGERQRVALGRALLSRPQLLLLDEPLASLDGARKLEALELIEQVRDRFSIPILYVSHAVEEILRLADRMVLMENGRAAAIGAPEEIFSRLDLPGVSGRQDAGAVIAATLAGHDADFALSRLSFAGGILLVPQMALPQGRRVRVRILARDVTLALTRPQDSSVLNIFPGTILEAGARHGPYVELRVDIGVPILARLTMKSLHNLALAPGKAVFASIKAAAISTAI